MRLLVCTGLILLGCRGRPVVSAEGDLQVTPARVEFGDTWLQATGRAAVRIANTGRAPRELLLEARAPFGAAAAITLAGGESREVELTFTPTSLGVASGVLTVTAPGAQRVITLQGQGVEAPPCDSTVCRIGTLEKETRRCVVSPQPDGTPCTDGCLVGTCAKGSCLGAARSCDDGDRCTVDGCTPGEGCVHLPKACPAHGPCTAGSCEAGGCVEAPVVDGTACGPADCVTAQVCVLGACVSRGVPEGAECGPQSVCQSRGRCVGQQCEQLPPTPIALGWSYAPPAGRTLRGLVADGLGNYFTAECEAAVSRCELVSFQPGGAERWRTAFPGRTWVDQTPPRAPLMIAGTRLVSTLTHDRVDVFDTASGAVAWALDVTAGEYGSYHWRAAASDGAGRLLLFLEWRFGASAPIEFLFGAVLSNGEIRNWGLAGHAGGALAVDKSGAAFVTHRSYSTAAPEASRTFQSVTAVLTTTQAPVGGGAPTRCEGADGGPNDCYEWGVKWQRTQPIVDGQVEELRAIHQGRLLLTHPQSTRLASAWGGAPLSSSLPVTVGVPSVVWGDGALFYAPQPCPAGPCYLSSIVAVDNRTLGVRQAALPPLDWMSELWLTHRGSALLSLQPSATPAQLLELDGNGKALMGC
ncbi:MAG: hypothetical protein H6Q89_5265, partial [Myxococcaceae bacterium]|nr:hypothetical protein [Myxococcaceae bacterium]